MEPPRIVFAAVEGFGKTTCAAYAPDPLIVMARGETGYQTLYGAGLVPRVPYVAVDSFPRLLSVLDGLMDNIQGRKTLAFDALGGFERLCHEEVCRRDFGNDWGERGFASYQKGFDLAVTDWLGFLKRLDGLRATHGVTTLILSHVKLTTIKNPDGPDYDSFAPDVHSKTWGATSKWSDAVLFGNYLAVTRDTDPKKKSKLISNNERWIHSERHNGFTAKNRFGMVPEIRIAPDPSKVWETIDAAIHGKAVQE